MQDNIDMTWFRAGQMSTYMWDAVAWSLTNRVSPTDINVLAERSVEGSTTDVVYREGSYSGTFCNSTWWGDGGTLTGITVCQSVVPSTNKCEKFVIYIDRRWDNAQGTGTTGLARRRNIVTHETGHSLGLRHPPTGTASVMADWTANPTYSTHDVGMVADAYP
jgi:hypothetical protein